MKIPYADGYYVYLLRCEDDSLYCGWTRNLRRRFSAHVMGRGARYTRSHRPVELYWFWEGEDASAARKMECRVKRLSRKEKLRLTISRQKEGEALDMRKKQELRLIKLWESDIRKAYELQMSFPKEENGFENRAYGNTYEQYCAYVNNCRLHAAGKKLENGFVPDTIYLLENEQGAYVGIFNLRHRLNPFLAQGPGHIGYGIRKEYRGRGYAKAGLQLLLCEARKIVAEDEIYLSVHKENAASLQVQLSNGAYIHHEDEKAFYTRIPYGNTKQALDK